MEDILIHRARQSPKPMNYEETFLDQNLAEFLELQGLESALEIEPDAFVQWAFPRLLAWRRPQYERIAVRYGYTANASDIMTLRDEPDFTEFLCAAIDAGPG